MPREQAALWTAPAFDRCLLLALFYPVAAIFVIWTVSGEVGPAERALGLKAADGPQRLVALTAVGFMILPFWRVLRSLESGWFLPWLMAAFASAVVLLVTRALAIASLALIGVMAGLAGAGAGALVVVFAGALVAGFAGIFSGVIAAPPIFAFAFAGVVAASIAGVVAAAGVGVGVGLGVAIARNMSGGMGEKSLAAFVSIMFLAGLVAARYLSPFPAWHVTGPLMLFLVLLTLVNAPFDWLSLGLTRFLLRRGIEQGGPWPYFYALIDALPRRR